MDWNNINTDRDTSGLGPIEYDQAKVPSLIRKYADDVRTKTYGQEVREAQARNAELVGLIANEAVDISNETKQRQNTVETQFNSVQQEITDKDVISAPEIIAARNGKNNLKERLDSEHQEVTEQTVKASKLPSALSIIKKPQALVSFVDDDGNPAVLTKLLPLAERYGVPFTVCIPSDFMLNNSAMSVSQLQMLQNEKGFEIASHAKTHTPINSQMTEEQQYIEIYESWRVMREKGLNIETIVYPYGQSTTYAREIVSRYYKSGVSTNEYLNDSPINTYSLGRYSFPGGVATLDYYKSLVDNAVANNKWLIWMLHCGQAEHNVAQQAILEQLIQYIQSLNVDIVNVTDGIDRVGNVIDYNEQELYIAKDGKNNMVNYIPTEIDSATGKERISFDMLPSQFSPNKTYKTIIQGNEQIALSPSKKRGTLTVIIGNPTFHSYRTYVDNLGNEFISYAKPDDNWDVWKRSVNTSGMQSHALSLTIPANSLRETSIPIGIYTEKRFAVVKPRTLPGGLMFSYFDGGLSGTVKIRIWNTTSTEITLNDSVWDYFLVDMN